MSSPFEQLLDRLIEEKSSSDSSNSMKVFRTTAFGIFASEICFPRSRETTPKKNQKMPILKGNMKMQKKTIQSISKPQPNLDLGFAGEIRQEMWSGIFHQARCRSPSIESAIGGLLEAEGFEKRSSLDLPRCPKQPTPKGSNLLKRHKKIEN